MPPLRLSGLFLLGLVALLSTARADVVYDISIIPKKNENFDTAAFRLWLPDHAGPVRGVAVVLDGINVDGRPLGNRVQWQNFAKTNSLALVTCYFKTEDLSSPHAYRQAEYGSGRALLAGLVALGKASAHPELGSAPLFLLGFSAGGQFSYSFAAFCPERTAAFVCNKSGNFQPPATAIVRAIPGLFIAGENDAVFRKEAVWEVYARNRKLGARWCLAVELRYGHNTANANDLALPFFEAVMRSYKPGMDRAGIAYDFDHQRIIPPGVPPKDATNTYWFPDEATLAVWKHFTTTPRK